MTIYETLPSGIKIVEYEPSLAATLADMWNQSSEDWGGSSTLQTAGEIISRHEAESHLNVYVALDGDTAVGYCSFGRYFGDANTLYIALLGVRPDYKNKKIGKALVLRCVNRTIELGYPRLDLFTWSGNTDAVPLYKKCGFMWEDRPDSVHLANFIPTVLTTPLFAGFFAKADWYADSTRALDIEPDGIEVNKFELFEYTWEKDGDTLAVGFERTGRHMRMIETADYKIALMAQDHELAFGMDYGCEFFMENKTGKPLRVKITGRQDGNIAFDCHREMDVAGAETLKATFRVGATEEKQDPWKVHPCLLADVEINGQTVTFGLGIETKFPLEIGLKQETVVNQVGMTARAYVDVHGALPLDTAITVHMPESRLLAFDKPTLTFHLPAKGKASIPVEVTTLAIGYEELNLDCIVRLENGETSHVTVPLYIFTRDMAYAFSGEDLYDYRMFNGVWELSLSKEDENVASVSHLTNGKRFFGTFDPPKLGKPYDDEFNLLKPNVTMYREDTAMVMEAAYNSGKFPGMAVTQVYRLYATGLVTRVHKVENRGDTARHVMLQDICYLELGDSTVFSYRGHVTQNFDAPQTDGSLQGITGIDPEGFDENWVFEASPDYPRGYCWAPEYKPAIKWGSYVFLEVDPGELAPGQSFATRPVVFALGLFGSANDFRNYARQVYNTRPAVPTHPVDVALNSYNPFIAGSHLTLDVVNNREQLFAGTVSVSSDGAFAAAAQTNPAETRTPGNTFKLALQPAGGVGLATVHLAMPGYERAFQRVMFFPQGEVTMAQEGTAYSVSNSAITFKADTKYGHVCYSLVDAKGQEWLLSMYPNHGPCAWWNPFLGGIGAKPPGMNDITILKENITAEFTEMRDNFGNRWQGLCTAITINEHDKFKGAVFKNYYLTLPGLPVLCSFFQLENGTGEYKRDRANIYGYFNPDQDPKDVVVDFVDKNARKHRLRMGSEDSHNIFYENVASMKGTRTAGLYAFHGNKYGKQRNAVWGCNKVPVEIISSMEAAVAAGEIFTSSPSFFIVTDKDLPAGALDDLERVWFG